MHVVEAVASPTDTRRQNICASIVRNFKYTEHSNESVIRALCTRGQWNEVRRFSSALEPMVAKGDFARLPGGGKRVIPTYMDQFVN
ncbi:hypothetical protein [Stenotrophomonas sp. SORGH_AS_0321]|uniref:hypothetical protein n=1 Tax=Stenotrophomonas sp. SORGH_AS_0321 TaxID=3041787 RepID=UPI0028653942|nr:hypothetical protein [Stenotrophomonas sp. SORGH_AS_0321]MDR6093160.1 hypothetical protein [Stenotrophomonas sp. SORGH_AS_0321]